MANIGFKGKNIIDIIKYRYLWFGITALYLIPCIAFMVLCMMKTPEHSPVKLGIDFTGGTFLQYGFEEKLTVKDLPRIRKVLDEFGQAGAIIQIQEPSKVLGSLIKEDATTEIAPENHQNVEESTGNTDIANETVATDPDKISGGEAEKPSTENALESEQPVKLDSEKEQAATEEKNTAEKPQPANSTATEAKSNDPETHAKDETSTAESNQEDALTTTDDSRVQTIISFRVKFLNEQETKDLNNSLRAKFGNFSIIQVTGIGPSLGKELLHNAMLALLLVFGGIVAYLTVRFQLDYAICALITLLHDAIFVIGIFAFLGLTFNTEVDSLFVTAVLTVIGFSVHDTIVVFDRIRENARFLSKKKSFNEICNDSVNQTLARSINTSVTTLFVLLTLYFFGGITTKDFVLAMTLGIAIGTYSSIFFASVLLAFWRDINAPKKKRRKVTAQ